MPLQSPAASAAGARQGPESHSGLLTCPGNAAGVEERSRFRLEDPGFKPSAVVNPTVKSD